MPRAAAFDTLPYAAATSLMIARFDAMLMMFDVVYAPRHYYAHVTLAFIASRFSLCFSRFS